MAKASAQMRDSLWSAESALRFIKNLRAHVAALVGDDEAAIRDTIEGEVDLDTLIGALIGHRQQALAMCKARRDLAAQYASAARADEERATKIEGMMLEALKVAGQERWTGPAGTLGIRQGAWSVAITNEMGVPLQYKVAEVSKRLIKDELEAARQELAAMSIDELQQAAAVEGLKIQPGETVGQLLARMLANRIPGAALVQGEPALAIYLPRSKKDAA